MHRFHCQIYQNICGFPLIRRMPNAICFPLWSRHDITVRVDWAYKTKLQLLLLTPKGYLVSGNFSTISGGSIQVKIKQLILHLLKNMQFWMSANLRAVDLLGISLAGTSICSIWDRSHAITLPSDSLQFHVPRVQSRLLEQRRYSDHEESCVLYYLCVCVCARARARTWILHQPQICRFLLEDFRFLSQTWLPSFCLRQ